MRVRAPSKVAIDTNIWITFLIGKAAHELENLLIEKNVIVLYSVELLAEINEVVQRPKFRKYFSSTALQIISDVFQVIGKYVDVKSSVHLCRDEKDNFLLALCIDGHADFLITGDADLLTLEKVNKTRIINYRQFIVMTDYE